MYGFIFRLCISLGLEGVAIAPWIRESVGSSFKAPRVYTAKNHSRASFGPPPIQSSDFEILKSRVVHNGGTAP